MSWALPGGRLRQRAAGVRAAVGARLSRTAPAVTGMVEQFTRARVVGWVSVPAGTPPVRIDLVLDDFVVTSTYAAVSASLSGIGSARRGRRTAGRPRPGQPVPGPDDDRRNTDEQVQVFSVRQIGIWDYVRRSTRISVRADGVPLPVHRHGMFVRPRTRGRRTVADLRELFARGHLLDQMGQVSLDRSLAVDWQRSVMSLHARVDAVVRDRFDHEVFLIYGTLLGAVREGGPIRHDGDFDIAYVSRHATGPEAAAELVEVALALVADGLHVECLPRALHVVDPADPEHRVDLFHLYFDVTDRLTFPFGVAGSSTLTRADWEGLRTIEFLGEPARVPVVAERVVAHIYGDDWRSPRPGFNWDVDRTAWAPEAHLSVEQQTRVHWANFYSRVHLDGGSTFSRFVAERPDVPRHMVDLGCGDGRDACALGVAGHVVLGLDASSEGVARGGEHVAELGLEDRVSFATCDVGDRDALTRHLEEVCSAADGPVGFYLRFFLHAIPEAVQNELLGAIDAVARPGDQLFAEFRTLADEAGQKAHGKHYRRFVDPEAFRAELERRHGFTIDYFTEGRGLSPHGDEDPVLCRLVARRTAA